MIDSMYHRDNQQETEQFIRKMARSKVPFKDMVTELNRLKRTRTVPWAVSAIKEVLKRPEQVPLKIDVVLGIYFQTRIRRRSRSSRIGP